MKIRALTMLCVVWLAMPAVAAESNWPMQAIDPDLENLPSLQNGLRLYTNYCLGCHSLAFQRYERTADDDMVVRTAGCWCEYRRFFNWQIGVAGQPLVDAGF